MSVNPVFPVVFNGGQMTDLPEFSGSLDGSELIEIVAAGAGQDIATEGVNYSITSALLGVLVANVSYINTVVTDGASYDVPLDVTRVLIDKDVGSPTSVILAASAGYGRPILVKDAKGDADINPITITFTGGELMDGLSSVVINTPFGYFWFNPLTGGFYGD